MRWFRLSQKQLWSLGKFIGLGCLCCLLVASCQSLPASESTGANGRISVGTTLRPRTLDPADSYEVAASNIMTSLGDRLYTYKIGSTNELEPQLATALPQISSDGLTYTIPLRQGVLFHDGTPFNAEAMAFSLNRFIQNGGKPSALLSDVVESVQVSGDYEITIKLKTAFAAFPALLAFSGTCAVSPTAYEIGDKKFLPTKFVGTGPYKLAQYTPSLLRLDVFKEYWGKKPANQGIDFQILFNSANLYNTFNTGAVDIAYQTFDPEQVESLRRKAATSGWQAIEERSNVVSYMMLNRKQQPLDNLKIRQAIALIIDRPLIAQRIFRNQAEPLYSMIPNSFESYQPVFQTVDGDGNVAQAKALLTEAGYSPANPLKLQLAYPASSLIRQQIANTLREYAVMKLDGIIQFQPQGEESTIFFANIPQGIYQLVLQDWYPDFGDVDNYIQPFLSCAQGSAATGCEEGAAKSLGSFYYSDRMNRLISQQRQEQDPQARRAIIAEIQTLVAQDIPLIPLVQNKDYAFAQQGLQGLQIDPILKLNFWEVKKG